MKKKVLDPIDLDIENYMLKLKIEKLQQELKDAGIFSSYREQQNVALRVLKEYVNLCKIYFGKRIDYRELLPNWGPRIKNFAVTHNLSTAKYLMFVNWLFDTKFNQTFLPNPGSLTSKTLFEEFLRNV